MGFHKVCHECGEKYKKKQFYKDGVHYKEQLLNDLKGLSLFVRLL